MEVSTVTTINRILHLLPPATLESVWGAWLEYGWQGVRLGGRVRRQRRPLTANEWTASEE